MSKRVKNDLLTYPPDYPTIAKVHHGYEVVNGFLRETGEVVRSYNSFGEPYLADNLARLADGEITPLGFAKEFGLLGYEWMAKRSLWASTPTFLPKSPAWLAFRTSRLATRNAMLRAVREMPPGDPVEWVISHARAVRFCRNVIGAMNEKDGVRLKYELLEAHQGPFGLRDSVLTVPLAEWSQTISEGGISSAIALANNQVGWLLSENIAGVRREFVTDPFGGNPASRFLGVPIEAVYWRLADAFESSAVIRCEADDCKRYFVARDKRQTYCPRFPGSTRSRCSSKLNVRNKRDRDRQDIPTGDAG